MSLPIQPAACRKHHLRLLCAVSAHLYMIIAASARHLHRTAVPKRKTEAIIFSAGKFAQVHN